MPLETATYIADLVDANPTPTDPKSEGDDHLRMVKRILQKTFAGFSGAVIVAGTEARGASVNDYVVTVAPDVDSNVDFQAVLFVATHTNTGLATLKVGNGVAAPFSDVDGAGLRAGTVKNQSLVLAVYVGGIFVCASAQGLQTVPTPPSNDNSDRIATTAFVTQAAFSAALPSQPGGSAQYSLVSQNGSVFWGGVSDFPLFMSGVV